MVQSTITAPFWTESLRNRGQTSHMVVDHNINNICVPLAVEPVTPLPALAVSVA
jgi:hypothetical protein